jgi:hypothetical protein
LDGVRERLIVADRCVLNARRKSSRRAEGAIPKFSLARRLRPSKRLDGPAHELGHRNVLTFRSSSKSFRLFFGQLDLRTDHDIMMAEVMA